MNISNWTEILQTYQNYLLKWFFCWLLIIIPFFAINKIAHRWAPNRKFSKTEQNWTDYKRELINFGLGAMASMLIYLISDLLHRNGIQLLYSDINQYGSLYYWLTFPLVLVMYDLYFYLTHRMLHTPWFFKHFHYSHHLSKNIGPLTSVSFHIVESFIIYVFMILYALVVPTHIDTVMFFFWSTRFIDVFGHSGYDYCPAGAYKKPWNIVFSNTFHHYHHHQEANGNFGLYFNYTDHFFGTQAKNYKQIIEKLYQQRQSEKDFISVFFAKVYKVYSGWGPNFWTLFGAILFYFSTQKFQLGWLFSLFSFMPWMYGLNQIKEFKATIKQILWIQFFITLCMFGWMPTGVTAVWGVPLTYSWLAYLVLVPPFLIYFFLFFCSRYFLKSSVQNIFLRSVLAGLVFVALDQALAFLDVTYSYFLYKQPALLSLARFGGGLFVSFCIVILSELTVYFIENRKRLGLPWAFAPVSVFVLVSLLLDYTYQPQTGSEVKVGLVSIKWEPTKEQVVAGRVIASTFDTESKAVTLLDQAIQGSNNEIDFYVLPESILRNSYYFPQNAYEWALRNQFQNTLTQARRPVFYGGKEHIDNRFYLSLPHPISADLPATSTAYPKIRLMPFGEVMPAARVFPQLHQWAFGVNPPVAGEVPLRGSFNGISWGGLLCNEIFYAGMLAEHRRAGAKIGIVLGNEHAVEKTMAYEILISAAVVRAIESSMPIIKSTISGISGAIDQKGRVISSLPTDQDSVATIKINLASEESTFFAKFPTLFIWISRFGALLALLLIVRHRESLRLKETNN